jgi:NMD protein affecting ribosome stability and mRNA decay
MSGQVCRHCGITIQREGDRWVDIREGGVYDFCTERTYGKQERGHQRSGA